MRPQACPDGCGAAVLVAGCVDGRRRSFLVRPEPVTVDSVRACWVPTRIGMRCLEPQDLDRPGTPTEGLLEHTCRVMRRMTDKRQIRDPGRVGDDPQVRAQGVHGGDDPPPVPNPSTPGHLF